MIPHPDYLPDLHYKSLADMEISYWWHATRINFAERILTKYIPAPQELRVLDYGCGTGGFLFEMNKRMHFKTCLGVDPSAQAIGYAKRYAAFYAQVEPNDLSVTRDKDLIFLMDVLEHMNDDGLFLRRLMNSVEADARVLITVPAHPFLYSSWDVALNHYRRYTQNSLSKIVHQAGGRVLYRSYLLSYLVAPIYFVRIYRKKRFNPANCELPIVGPKLNNILRLLNRFEMFVGSFLRIPLGSTLISLIINHRSNSWKDLA